MTQRVQAWRWRIASGRPSVQTALHVGVAARAALMNRVAAKGSAHLPAAFHHAGTESQHGHAFYLAEDADSDGLIDHVLVFAETGIDGWLIGALASIDELKAAGKRIRLAPDWMGRRGEGGLFGPARSWRAATPFVTPKWRLSKTGRERPRFTPEAQLRAEVEARGLLAPSAIDWAACAWAGEALRPANTFKVHRSGRTPDRREITVGPPADAVASFPTLTFAVPVWGPLAFGYGAHFGLGLLTPVE